MLQIYNNFLNDKRFRAKMCFPQGLWNEDEGTKKGEEGGKKQKWFG